MYSLKTLFEESVWCGRTRANGPSDGPDSEGAALPWKKRALGRSRLRIYPVDAVPTVSRAPPLHSSMHTASSCTMRAGRSCMVELVGLPSSEDRSCLDRSCLEVRGSGGGGDKPRTQPLTRTHRSEAAPHGRVSSWRVLHGSSPNRRSRTKIGAGTPSVAPSAVSIRRNRPRIYHRAPPRPEPSWTARVYRLSILET